MRRMTPICALAAIACASEPEPSSLQRGWPDLRPGARGGELPVGMPGIAFSGPGGYTWSGALAPGSGTFTDAPLWDWMATDTPPSFGTGSYDVTVDGVRYASDAAESFSAIVDDGAGREWVLAGSVRFESDASGVELARVLYVVAPRGEVVAGASLAIDGVDRLALFAAGRSDAEAPEVLAAAASGTITITAADLAPGGRVTAQVTGELGRIAWEERPPGEPPPDTPPAAVAPGAYRLTLGALVEAACDGTLAGQESSYGSLTPADLGFVDADVALSGGLVVEGAALAGGFGSASLSLDWDGAAYVGTFDHVTAGPFGVDRSLSALAVLPADAGPLPVMIAAVFDDRSGSGGWCAVQWEASLAP